MAFFEAWIIPTKKNAPKPWQSQEWCVPPKANAEFFCAMENRLEAYKQAL